LKRNKLGITDIQVTRCASQATSSLYVTALNRLSKLIRDASGRQEQSHPMSGQSRFLNATVFADGRGSRRFIVQLATSVEAALDRKRARIHDLSETGLKLEIPNGFGQVETLIVELPYLGLVEAKTIWSDGDFYGVEFLQPIKRAAVSASLLQSRPISPIPHDASDIAEMDLGSDPSIEQIIALAVELEGSKSSPGNQLVGFRKSPSGRIKALVLKAN